MAWTLARFADIRGTIFCKSGIRVGAGRDTIEIGGGSKRHATKHRTVGGVDHRRGIACVGGHPFACEEKVKGAVSGGVHKGGALEVGGIPLARKATARPLG